MKAITFMSRKGGVGKSTSALHVAAVLSHQGKSTLVVDDDPNRPLISWIGKGALHLDVVSQAQLGKRLGSAPDFVIWDSEAHPSPEDMKDLASGADLLVVPCAPDHLSLGALLALREDLHKIGAASPLVVMMTLVQPNSRDGERYQEALREEGFDVLSTCIRRYAVYAKALQRGLSVKDAEGGEGAWTDYVQATEELLDRLEGK